jgi:hypothetical protein
MHGAEVKTVVSRRLMALWSDIEQQIIAIENQVLNGGHKTVTDRNVL